MKTHASKSLILLSLAVLSAHAFATPVGKMITLPKLLEDQLGDAEVSFSATESTRYLPKHFADRGSDFPAEVIPAQIVVHTANIDERSQRADLARAVMDVLYDDLYQNEMQRKTLMIIPSDPNAKIPARERLTNYAVAKLTGATSRHALQILADKYASDWWELRLNSSKRDLRLEPRRGSRVLISTRLYGYKGSNFTPGDVGHASMGVLTLGGVDGDRTSDVFLNPGAKTPEGYESSQTSSIKGDPKVPNRIERSNFWDWLETQVTLRYLNVDMRLLTLTEEQDRVVADLMTSADKVDYGMFQMVNNNCANGARDFFNSLLPLDAEIPMFRLPGIPVVDWAPMALPGTVIEGAARSFHSFAKLSFLSHRPAGMNKTPDTGVQKFPNHDDLPTFKVYKAWEDKYLAKH